MKGEKRFKNLDLKGNGPMSPNNLNLSVTDANEARELFKKMTMQSAYNAHFGAKPATQDDFMILKEKPFSKLPSAQILKPEVRNYLQRWLTINDQDKFTGRIFFTVREMYTVVKSRMAEKPTSHDNHASHAELNVTLPRFDKIITGLNEKRRNQAMSVSNVPEAVNLRYRSFFPEGDIKIGSKFPEFSPSKGINTALIYGKPNFDPKDFKMRFLAGDKQAVMYQDPNEPKSSSYQVSHKGKQVSPEQRASILDNQHLSFVGQLVPDPNQMSKCPSPSSNFGVICYNDSDDGEAIYQSGPRPVEHLQEDVCKQWTTVDDQRRAQPPASQDETGLHHVTPALAASDRSSVSCPVAELSIKIQACFSPSSLF